MGAARLTFGVLAATAMAHALAQTPYPDLTLQDVAWTSGTHHYAVTQRILSPSTPDLPVDIGGTADAEFVSGTQVRLRPGFHAGGFANNNSRFRAYINEALGPPGDVIIISPAPDGSEPYGSIVDNVIHVHKWEKVEVGLRLPQEYQEAIDRFFTAYYPAASAGDYTASPTAPDAAHDLNPYADDSLQLVMTLTKPDGSQTMKWGFFMREAKWGPATLGPGIAILEEDLDDPSQPYSVRFRFAPDLEGTWMFTLRVSAPHTSRLNGMPLPNQQYTGYRLRCIAPLPDNHGHLEVNTANRRLLQFTGNQDVLGDEQPFFPLGLNMADAHHGNLGLANPPGNHWYSFYERDFDQMKRSMELLHEGGGNYLRMFLMRNIFAPEWVNLGVYDAFRTPQVCALEFPTPCDKSGWTTNYVGNCQYQAWAFDQMVDHARANNIYIQLCIDPYPPIIAYEKFLWGAHPYVIHFLEPNRQQPPANPYNMRRFFYTNGDSTMVNDPGGVFYYWKRKYKYIMSRWGYSVNVPIIEPFNETDQMLSHRSGNMVPPSVPCEQIYKSPYWDICMENRVNWTQDVNLPKYISSWLNDITSYVRGEVDPQAPVTSPLGERGKLFLMSYADAEPANTSNSTYFMPFRNPNVDLIDVHKGLYPVLQGTNTDLTKVDRRIYEGVQHANTHWLAQPGTMKKPFNQGEYNHYTNFTIPNPVNPSSPPLWSNDIEKIFHNYDVSFHNELWASAFSGKFAAGTTWHWERVFWWPDALPPPPEDAANNFQWSPTQQFSNVAGDENRLQLFGTTKWVKNKRLHNHFQPLADLLNRPSVQELGIFSGAFMPDKFFDDDDSDGINPLETYYLRSDQSTAIGWVHNRNASVARSFYVKSGTGFENFLGCTAPTTASIKLSGFFPLHAHYITWFPTRIGATDLPPDSEFPNTLLQSDANGDIVINLDGEFNGVANNYLDTLHADYAFVITPGPFVKSLAPDAVEAEPGAGWDFMLYPNPTRDMFVIVFDDESSKEMEILDLTGRRLLQLSNVTATRLQLSVSRFAMGAYWVQVTTNGRMKTKKLIIH